MSRLVFVMLLSVSSTALLGQSDCIGDVDPTEPTAQPTETETAQEPTVTEEGTPVPGAEDLNMKAEDFPCITTGEKVGRFYVFNELDHLDEAVEVAGSASGGTFPVGTIVQLIPTEAMVKRHEGWNSQTHDWEFFFLEVSESGTTIIERGSDSDIGATGVQNGLGGNCFSCHAAAEPQYDFICADDHGCEPLPFNETQISLIQNSDPRCQ